MLVLPRPWQQQTHFKVTVLIISVSNGSRFVVKYEGTDSDLEKTHQSKRSSKLRYPFSVPKETTQQSKDLRPPLLQTLKLGHTIATWLPTLDRPALGRKLLSG